MIDDDKLAELEKYFTDRGYKFFPTMAAIAEGTKEVINYVAAEIQKLPPIKRYEPEITPVEDYTVKSKRDFKLTVEDGIFIVEAEWLLKILETVDPDDYEALQYFQRVLIQSGIIKALEDAGINDGDTVKVYDIEFDYIR